MSMTYRMGLVGLAALLGGCIVVDDVGPGPDYACDLVGYPSISVDIRDEQGAPICDATVVARDGAFSEQLRAFESYPGKCTWSGVTERPGNYEVTVSKPGYETAVYRNVYAGSGLCHVDTAELDVTLVRDVVGCTANIVASFDLDVRDELGRPACDATVIARDGAFEFAFVSTPLRDGSCYWEGPLERPGNYEFTVSKPGYTTQVLRNLSVTKDSLGCHVVTRSVDVKLEPLGNACTENLVQPFNLDIRDENLAPVCDAEVLVFERGIQVATLEPFATAPSQAGCSWFWQGAGGGDRAGVYDLHIIKPGYVPVELEDVNVSLDASGCHAVPVLLNAKLSPAPPAGQP